VEETATFIEERWGPEQGRDMTTRLAALGAAVAFVALVVSMMVPAVAGSGDRRVTLRFAEDAADDEQFETDVDVGEAGFGVGDYTIIENEPFFNRALTKQVGTVSGDIVVAALEGETATLEIDLTFSLESGLITVEGPISFAPDSDPVQEVAVTGGTDAYKTVHGELLIDARDEAGLRVTFRLIV
jgi:hypothetical protein